MTPTTLPPTMTPAVARLLWHEALSEWSEHEMLASCAPCSEGTCPRGQWLAAQEQAAWCAWLSARRLAGEAI